MKCRHRSVRKRNRQRSRGLEQSSRGYGEFDIRPSRLRSEYRRPDFGSREAAEAIKDLLTTPE
jgi:hypothetical protein